MARILTNVIITFVPVVVTSLSYQKSFEFLFVNLLTLVAHFDEHLDDFLKVDPFNSLAVSLLLDVTKKQRDKSSLNILLKHNIFLELSSLHVLDRHKVSIFPSKIFVHVQ